MDYPEIPLEMRQELDRLRSSAAAAFQLQDWEAASRKLDETYKYLLAQQQRYQTRFHKGWELHNGGIALLSIPHYEEGVRRILLAYVEDALSAEVGHEKVIDDGLAGSVLRGLKTAAALLNAIQEVANRRKRQELPIPGDPDDVLVEALAELKLNYEEARESLVGPAEKSGPSPKRAIEDLVRPFEKRCFVGGNYFVGGPYLEETRQIVSKEGFDPIVARDFEMDKGDVHHRSLLLLHLCRKAVFEVSVPAGQLMELERCRDYDIEPLLVRHVLPNADPMVSEMIGSMARARVSAYSTCEELAELIRDYLRS